METPGRQSALSACCRSFRRWVEVSEIRLQMFHPSQRTIQSDFDDFDLNGRFVE